MTAMYPMRIASSVSKETDQDLRDISDEIQVPVAQLVRIAVEEKVNQLKAGIAKSRLGGDTQGEQMEQVIDRMVAEIRRDVLKGIYDLRRVS